MLILIKTVLKFLSKGILGASSSIISMIFLSFTLHWILDKGIHVLVSKFGFKKDRASHLLKFILIFIVGLLLISAIKAALKHFLH